MIKSLQTYSLFFLLVLFGSCVKESMDFPAVVNLYLIVTDNAGNPINGATVNLYKTETEYLQAVALKSGPPAGFKSLQTAQATVTQNGNTIIQNGYVHLDALDPETPYYLLVTYYDNTLQQNLSNIGISGYVNPLPARTSVHATMVIAPDNSNIIFYSTASNQVPIYIEVSATNAFSSKTYLTLTGIYAGLSVPGVNEANTVRAQRDPGTFNYNAKSADGCAWAGSLQVIKGQNVPVDLDKCSSGQISFYTTSVNDTLLPLTVTLNNFDSPGQVTASRASLVCTDDRSNTLTFIRDAGYYSYVVQSASGRCIWTGNFTVQTDDCIIVPLDYCE